MLLIHQGGKLPKFTSGNGCSGIYGDILPILSNLDPAFTTVVSGHTHWAYVCHDKQDTREGRLMTSAGKHGYFVTDLRLRFDPSTKRLINQFAINLTVGNGEMGVDSAEQALVARYATAVAPIAYRVVGRLTQKAPIDPDDGESAAANLIADSMLAATRGSKLSGAQLALVNATGVRVTLPAGNVLYKDAFAMMPFGNNLLVMTLTGEQLKTALEQQYAIPIKAGRTRPAVLAPSDGFTYSVDMTKPEGSRVFNLTLNGKAVTAGGRYRVAVNNYLASGGDSISAFTQGTEVVDTRIVDLDALVDWIAPGRTPPKPNRIRIAL